MGRWVQGTAPPPVHTTVVPLVENVGCGRQQSEEDWGKAESGRTGEKAPGQARGGRSGAGSGKGRGREGRAGEAGARRLPRRASKQAS